MMELSHSLPRQRKANRNLILSIVGIWLLVIGAAYAWLQYHDARYEQWRMWEARLSANLNERTDALEAWIATQRTQLLNITENTSVRLYQTELVNAPRMAGGAQEVQAEEQYLQRLLDVKAEEAGFSQGAGGLAILDPQGNILMRSNALSLPAEELASLVEGQPVTPKLQEMFMVDGMPYIGFIEPMFSVQGDAHAQNVVGYLYGLRQLDASLVDLLRTPNGFDGLSYALLKPTDGQTIHLLQPRGDASFSIQEVPVGEFGLFASALNTQAMAEISMPKGGIAWAMGQRLDGAPWVLMHAVRRNVAMQGLSIMSERNIAIFAAVSILVVGSIVLLWRGGREERQQVLEQTEQHEAFFKLADAMMRVVDQRDKYAQNHSRKVGRMARLIAEEMQQDTEICRTAEVAGTLLNVGKVFVPEAMLTRSGPLRDEEKHNLRRSIAKAADLLESVDFYGPVSETIRQSQESWNGQGLTGAKAEDILLTSRIIAVANATVGMMSPRSYRKKMSKEDVIKVLQEESGKSFDPAVVVAVMNLLHNHRDRLYVMLDEATRLENGKHDEAAA